MNIVEIEPDFLNIEDIQLPEFKISEPSKTASKRLVQLENLLILEVA